MIEVAKKSINFIALGTYNKLENFIHNYIPLNSQNQFINRLNSLQQIRHREYVQNHIRYDFQYIPNKISSINNSILRNTLLSHFTRLFEGKLPDAFFSFNYNPRVSDLYLKGVRQKGHKQEDLSSYDIERYLFNPLVKNGKIIVYNKSFFLCKITNNFITYYNNKFSSIPHHTPILREILSIQHESFSIETPVWLYLSNRQEYLTGHIDLNLTSKNIIYVSDYKSSITDMIRSLPQVSTYGLLLGNNLNNTNNSFNFKINCVTFSKDLAYSYNPNILNKEILDFVKLMNKKRNNRLMDRSGNDLEDLIKEIIYNL
ncbi:hypothetical protein LCGC14_1351360 [marine sediment metagenome]|uniref:PD-(D/E)XK endonuclease-like domain-containing protein n=1 Tax=marine sediment metagenome TaxID=412755 RepID=A0A0F9ND45_9ZZZZ